MGTRRRGFSPEFKAEAVKMVIESSKTVNEVARDIHIGSETLRTWVNKHKAEHVDEELPLTASERARLKELEREVRELRLKCEFLGKCSAFFAREYR